MITNDEHVDVGVCKAADLLVIVGAVAGSDDGHVLLGIGESGQLLLQGSLAVCLALPQS